MPGLGHDQIPAPAQDADRLRLGKGPLGVRLRRDGHRAALGLGHDLLGYDDDVAFDQGRVLCDERRQVVSCDDLRKTIDTDHQQSSFDGHWRSVYQRARATLGALRTGRPARGPRVTSGVLRTGRPARGRAAGVSEHDAGEGRRRLGRLHDGRGDQAAQPGSAYLVREALVGLVDHDRAHP